MTNIFIHRGISITLPKNHTFFHVNSSLLLKHPVSANCMFIMHLLILRNDIRDI